MERGLRTKYSVGAIIMEEIYLEGSLPDVMVSNMGNFYRRERTIICTSPKGKEYTRTLKAQKLAAVSNGLGYLQVKTSMEGELHRKYAHVLVWEAFNGPIPDGYEIDHIDDNKQNNQLSNLQLLTRKQNMAKCHERNPHIKYNLKNQEQKAP